MEGTGIFEHLVNLKRMHKRTICVGCGKQYEIKSEKDRKIKDKLHRKFCPNGRIMTFANNI